MPNTSSDPLRLVIFDLDGTVIDSHTQIVQRMVASIKAHSFEVPDDKHMFSVIGLPLEHMYERVVPQASADEWKSMADYQRASGRKRRDAGEAPEPLFPGAHEAIEALDASGYLLAVTTNKGRPGTDHVLTGHDIARFFVTTRTAHDGHQKPHPDAVHDLLRKTGVEAENCVLIGDTETDIMTANNAGVKAIGVAWGYHPAVTLTKSGAQRIAASFNQVPQLVEELLGSGV